MILRQLQAALKLLDPPLSFPLAEIALLERFVLRLSQP
jgi:hypothetical protein